MSAAREKAIRECIAALMQDLVEAKELLREPMYTLAVKHSIETLIALLPPPPKSDGHGRTAS